MEDSEKLCGHHHLQASRIRPFELDIEVHELARGLGVIVAFPYRRVVRFREPTSGMVSVTTRPFWGLRYGPQYAIATAPLTA